MPTVADLGKLLKQKYPGPYDSMDDAEAGRRLKAKYPDSEYAKFEDLPVGMLGALPGPALYSGARVEEVDAPSTAKAIADVTLGGVGRGVGGVVEGTGGVLRAAGAEQLGGKVKEAGEYMTKPPAWLDEISARPDRLYDPLFITNLASTGVGSSLSFFLPGAGAARLAGAAGRLPIGAWRTAAQWAAGSATGAALESLVDAGSAYNDAVDKQGASPEIAAQVFSETVKRELPTTMLTNALGEFAPRGGSMWKRALQFGWDTLMEGAEEVAQGVAQRSAANKYLPKQTPLLEGAPEEFLGGALGGAVVSGGRAIADRVAPGAEPAAAGKPEQKASEAEAESLLPAAREESAAAIEAGRKQAADAHPEAFELGKKAGADAANPYAERSPEFVAFEAGRAEAPQGPNGQESEKPEAPEEKKPPEAEALTPDEKRTSELTPEERRLVERGDMEISGGRLQFTEERDSETPSPNKGKETTVSVPGEQSSYAGNYEVRELADVQASHNPFSFEANPNYAHQNDRDYKDPQNAARVIEHSNPEKFQSDYILSESPTAEHGAPVIDEAGNVLGGNNRTMTLARVYRNSPEAAARYREQLARKASQFGLAPETIGQMKQPVLVRRVAASDAQKAITDFNKKASAALRPGEQAVTDGKRLSPRSVDAIVNRIEDAGDDGSLADALRGEGGAEVVNALVKDGVITEQEKAGLVDEKGNLTADAKSRVAKALTGRLFSDARSYNQTAPEMRNKLERIAPHVLRSESREGWSLTDQVREAVELLADAKARRAKNLDELAGQTTIDGRSYSPEALAIAKALQQSPNKAAAAFRRYANDEALSRPGAQASMFEPPSRAQAFADAFSPETRTGLDKDADEALGRLHAALAGQLNSGLDPAILRDLAVVTARDIQRAAVTFAKWSARMVKALGTKFKRHALSVWGQAKRLHAKYKASKWASERGSVSVRRKASRDDQTMSLFGESAKPKPAAPAKPRAEQQGLFSAEEEQQTRSSAATDKARLQKRQAEATFNSPLQGKFSAEPGSLFDDRQSLFPEVDATPEERILDALDRLSEPDQEWYTGRVRQESGLSKADFDRAAIALANRQKVFLTEHDHPNNISAEDRDALVDGKYVALIKRSSPGKARSMRPFPDTPHRFDATADEVASEAMLVYRNGRGDEPGVLYTNMQALEILTYVGQIFETADIAALYADPERVRIVKENLRMAKRNYSAKIAKKFQQLLNEFSKAADDPRGLLLVEAGTGRTITNVKASIRHEFHHAYETDMTPDGAARFLDDALTRAAKRRLRKDGYPDDDVVLASEIGAHLAQGPTGWRVLGIRSLDDATRLWRRYLSFHPGVYTNPRLHPKLRQEKQQTDGVDSNQSISESKGSGELRPSDDGSGGTGSRGVGRRVPEAVQQESAADDGAGRGLPGARGSQGALGSAREEVGSEAEFIEYGSPDLFGAQLIARGVNTFNAWRDAMIQRFGSSIKPKLLSLWGRVKSLARELAKDETGSVDFAAIATAFRESNIYALGEWALSPVRSRLNREGGGQGRELMDLIARIKKYGEVEAGKATWKLIHSGSMKLKRDEWFNLLDVMEGRAQPMNQAVTDAHLGVRNVFDGFANSAIGMGMNVKRGGRWVPFQMLTNWFPHTFPRVDDLKSGAVRRDVLENVVRIKAAKDDAEAKLLLDAYVQLLETGNQNKAQRVIDYLVQSGQAANDGEAYKKLLEHRDNIRRHGSLEHSRSLNLPFYDPNPQRVLPFVAAGAARRLSEVAHLGQNDEALFLEYAKILKAGGNADLAKRWTEKALGRAREADSKAEQASRLLRSIQVAKLGLAAVQNAGQMVNTWMQIDSATFWGVMARAAISRAARQEMRGVATASGAVLDPVLHEVHDYSGEGRLQRAGNALLKVTGFNTVERWNRIIAAEAGRKWAVKLHGKARAGNKRAAAMLRELGLDPAKPRLTANDRLRAASTLVDMTQFRSRFEDFPEWTSSPGGKLLWQFKSFAYNQARFLARETAGEIASGNWGRGMRNLLIMAIAFPLWGELVRAFKDAILGREPKEFESALERWYADLITAGALGLMTDAAEGARFGRLAETAAGPNLGFLAETGETLYKMGDEDKRADAAVRYLKRHLPLGNAIAATAERIGN